MIAPFFSDYMHIVFGLFPHEAKRRKIEERKYFRKSRFDGNSRPSAHFKFLFLSGEVLFETKKVTRARWIDVNSAGAIFACDTSRSKHLCMSEQFEHGAFKGRVFFYCWGSFFLKLDFHICLSSLMQVIHYRLGGVLLSTTCGYSTSTTTNPSWVPSFHFHSSFTPLTHREEL